MNNKEVKKFEDKIEEGMRVIFCEDTKCPPIDKCPDDVYPTCWKCWAIYFKSMVAGYIKPQPSLKFERIKG